MEADITLTVSMLVTISCFGTIFNSIVIVVFAKSKKKHTSTTYILILAFVDLLTCLVTIPLCVVMELVYFETESDILCKSYHLFTATTVPLSAILMVVIAIDRYIHICGPNPMLMTTPAILVTVCGIVLFSLSLGAITAMAYAVVHAQLHNFHGNASLSPMTSDNKSIMDHFREAGIPSEENLLSTEFRPSIQNITFSGQNESRNSSLEMMAQMLKRLDFAVCALDFVYFDFDFYFAYEKVYSAVYAVSCLMIILVYGRIYHFVASRRCQVVKRYNPKFLQNPSATMTTCMSSKENISLETNMYEKEQKESPSSESLIRKHFTSKKERVRRQNIKTASMLASVAFVFIVAFLPAWLMKYRFVSFNNFVFHFYFIYCVINPLIYALCTSNFKNSLKMIINAKRRAPFIL